jgi:ribA/ribD-fused uncharacterized protein
MINSFRGEYYFLSNMYPHSAIGKSVEHYFQAAKSTSPEDYQYVVDAVDGYEARTRGKKILMRDDWSECKEDVMHNEIGIKFYCYPSLAKLLLDTGDEELVEGNIWGDRYWGVDIKTNVGENKLGKILMKIREELRCR